MPKIKRPWLNMSPVRIKNLARRTGWTLIKKNAGAHQLVFRKSDLTLVVNHKTGTVVTCLSHPIQGKTSLVRREVPMPLLAKLFVRPRAHTGKGYKTKEEKEKQWRRRLNDRSIGGVMEISLQYLRDNPNHIFVFGDNTQRRGCKGAAFFRYEPNSYGFITKKYPSFASHAYYRPDEYRPVFEEEMRKLIQLIEDNPGKTYLITKLGSSLANRFRIWEEVIESGIEILGQYKNVVFLWKVP